MGNNRTKRIDFNCDYCGIKGSDRASHFRRKVRHFCSMKCYALFRMELLPIEEQPRFGSGNTPEERAKRKKVRSELNHAIRDGKIQRHPCEVCANQKTEAHHDSYDKPLEVRWLCFKHHREHHKQSTKTLTS